MSTYIMPNMTDGIDSTLVEVASQVPSMIWGLLLFVFLSIWLGGMFQQNKKIGYSDMPMWSLLASLSTLIVCFILGLTEGLITLDVLAIVFSVTILSGFWFFLSRGRNEN